MPFRPLAVIPSCLNCLGSGSLRAGLDLDNLALLFLDLPLRFLDLCLKASA
jgi:hypothetical protein